MASKKNEIDIELPASMIADAISRAAALGASNAKALFTPFFEEIPVDSETKERYLVRLDPEGPAEIREYDRPRKSVISSHEEVVSFTDWVTAHKNPSDELPEVFIGPNMVRAKWGVQNHECRDEANLPLSPCEAWQAFEKLQKGVGQQELHRLLTTALHGCIPEELSFHVATLSHYVNTDFEVAISRTGLANMQARENLKLKFVGRDGEDESEIPVNWMYRGPVWTCFQDTIEIPVRMVISKPKDSGLLFQFAPLGLEAKLIEYRRFLAETIESNLQERSIPVYIGGIGN